MRLISEAESELRVTRELAFAAAKDALIAAATDGVTFPASLFSIGVDGRRISVKAAALNDTPGVKIGSFWPNNSAHGLPSHNSLILLADKDTGRIHTIVEASRANAMRTAAADAVATDALARPDAQTLAVFGSGQQAYFEAQALSAVRKIRDVLVTGRHRDSADKLVERLVAIGIAARTTDAETACRNADIIVTATPSRAPLFDAAWVQPGTHVSAMGADGRGKQELPIELLNRAALFCDLPSQATVLGEFQSIAGDVETGKLSLTAIGDVLRGSRAGRTSGDQITVFDSSGLGLQDLCLALHLSGQTTQAVGEA